MRVQLQERRVCVCVCSCSDESECHIDSVPHLNTQTHTRLFEIVANQSVLNESVPSELQISLIPAWKQIVIPDCFSSLFSTVSDRQK